MKKILYVEDEPFLGKIVKESLESRQFNVLLVADGKEVLSSFKKFQPDICVLDIMLPNVDGFTLSQSIRELDRQTPIIFLTAKNQTADVVKGFELGGNDYIRKPFSMEELIVRVNNLLQTSQQNNSVKPNQEHLDIGSFTFYPKKQILQKGNSQKSLSHREAQLLALLGKKANTTIERKHILETIWGNDSFFNSRNLDVYIRKLRNYLSEDESVQIITLKGVGYRMVF